MSAACLDTEKLLLEGSDDPLATSRVEAHLGRCSRCQSMHERLLALRQDVQRSTPPLDDVTRARLLAALAPALDGLAAGDARPSTLADGWRRMVAGRATRHVALGAAGALIAVGALALVLGAREGGPVEPTASPSIAAAPARPAPLAANDQPGAGAAGSSATPARSRALSLLLPSSRSTARGFSGAASSRLDNDRPGLLEARLEERAALALAGPGSVEVIGASEGVIELRLTTGALVVDYDRRRGGRLRIHSPGAVTEVVGTLFTVEVLGSRSRVAVQRGKVVVEVAGQPRLLHAGQSLASDAQAAGPVPSPTRALLRQFQRQRQRAPQLAQRSASAPLDEPLPTPPGPTSPPSSEATVTAPLPAIAVAPGPIAPPAAPPLPSPPAAPIAPPVAPPVAPSAAERYRLAEAAMARADHAEARRQLQSLISTGGHHSLASLARYELAQMSLRSGDGAGAVRWLDQLTALGAPPDLEESGRFLRCEVALAGPESTLARRCLQEFRAAYPHSPRDPLALGLLLRITPAAELCGPSRAVLEGFLRQHPGHRFAAELAARRDACPR